MMTVNGMKRSFLDQKLIFILRKVACVRALAMIKKTNAMLFNEELEIFQPFKHGQHVCSYCQFVLLVRSIDLYGIMDTINILESLLM